MQSFDPAQTVMLEESCRIADRLDRLDAQLSGRDFLRVESNDDGEHILRVDSALSEARQQANVLKQLLAYLRLPDEAGKRPQFRGARGVQKPTVPVSSLDRFRKSG